jgi:hypothetical protein
MAQIKNYQQLELLSTNFIRRDETDPLRLASLEVAGNVDIGGDLDVTGTTSGIDHGELDGLDDDDHDGATYGYILREPNAGVLNNYLTIWDGIGGRNLKQVNLFTNAGSDLFVGGTLHVDWDGDLKTIIGGNYIELGYDGKTGGISYLDFWAEGDGGDYDARILVDGGTASTGYGEMDITARGGLNLYVSPDDLYVNNNIEAVGNITASYGGRYSIMTEDSLQIGVDSTTGDYSLIDFWGDGDGGGYDCRIYVDGGTATASYGEMVITARGGLDLEVWPNDVYVDNDIDVKYDIKKDGTIGYIYHPITAVEILDTSSSTDTTRNQIDVSTDGIPTSAKALNVRIAVRDSGSAANDCYVVFYNAAAGGSTTGTFSPMPVNDRYGRYTAVLNCGSNGDIWWTAAASGSNTLDITVTCTGYWL